MRTGIRQGMLTLAVLTGTIGAASGNDAKPTYPAMAPVQEYRMASDAEISLARSSAPKSVSDDAEVLTFGEHGYETAVKGKNGFVCLVERSWATDFDDPGFWNPKIRGPMCLNAAAAHTILPGYIERTKWVLSGVSQTDMLNRTKAEIAAKTLKMPEPGAMSYMLAKGGFLNDAAGHWHPHVMFYVAHSSAASWGANLPNSPVFAAEGNPEPITTYFVVVPTWSDGTAADMGSH